MKREVAFEEKQTEVGSNSTFKLRCELETLALVPWQFICYKRHS
jgi:hypothetical protein